ncbi:glutathione S-transferase family protein [Phenylobacterium sp.]|uniref:glutathione S-transferase family protein n=1 Tax=Phenylobacterium sp. TaxID=1871053 RepID=UPI0025D35D1C|nr:glutathione S-transferase [Phenylobacterium sp.]
MPASIRLHGLALSGHSHKVEMFLRLLGLPFDNVDAGAPQRQAEAFARLNPLRQIPVLEDGDLALADSNAILVYLARRYDPEGSWLPQDPAAAAGVQRWLSISAGEIKYGPANARAVHLFGLKTDLADAHAVAARLLAFMDQTLATQPWLAGAFPTLADIACYPYIARAPEGGIDLGPYSAVTDWVARVEALPGLKPMPSAA